MTLHSAGLRPPNQESLSSPPKNAYVKQDATETAALQSQPDLYESRRSARYASERDGSLRDGSIRLTPHSTTNPNRTACTIASLRLWTPSLPRMALTWNLAVCSLMPRRWAMRLLGSPWERSWRT